MGWFEWVVVFVGNVAVVRVDGIRVFCVEFYGSSEWIFTKERVFYIKLVHFRL